MSNLFIINDTHLGVRRQTGTTHESLDALLEWQYKLFKELLEVADGSDLCILGDLFDSRQVSKEDEIRTFKLLNDWLKRNSNTLYLIAGNHDLSKNSEDISSFENLCTYLHEMGYGDKLVTKSDGAIRLSETVAAVSHVANQTLFDKELATLADDPKLKFVLVHCNYDNHFAAQADHSLNISAEQAAAFDENGIHLIFAHEHHYRTIDNCTIIGNQIPTSVADCLNCEAKYIANISDGTHLATMPILPVEAVYTEVDWREADKLHGADLKFIRLAGRAEHHEAGLVVDTLATLRRNSDAFVITNAVRIGEVGIDANTETDLADLNVKTLVVAEMPEKLKPKFEAVSEYV